MGSFHCGFDLVDCPPHAMEFSCQALHLDDLPKTSRASLLRRKLGWDDLWEYNGESSLRKKCGWDEDSDTIASCEKTSAVMIATERAGPHLSDCIVALDCDGVFLHLKPGMGWCLRLPVSLDVAGRFEEMGYAASLESQDRAGHLHKVARCLNRSAGRNRSEDVHLFLSDRCCMTTTQCLRRISLSNKFFTRGILMR